MQATFTLNAAAKVRFVVTVTTQGRKVGGRCVGLTRANRHHAACSVQRTIGHGAVAGKAGANTFRFSAKLAPGAYRLVVTPAGGTARTVSFRVTG